MSWDLGGKEGLNVPNYTHTFIYCLRQTDRLRVGEEENFAKTKGEDERKAFNLGRFYMVSKYI